MVYQYNAAACFIRLLPAAEVPCVIFIVATVNSCALERYLKFSDRGLVLRQS